MHGTTEPGGISKIPNIDETNETMKTALKFVKKIYKQIYTSIAFYPVVISACFLVLDW